MKISWDLYCKTGLLGLAEEPCQAAGFPLYGIAAQEAQEVGIPL